MTTQPQPHKSLAPKRAERSIFRAEARQHYLTNQDKVVFPRLLSHKLFFVLWLIALAFLVVGALITFWPLITVLQVG